MFKPSFNIPGVPDDWFDDVPGIPDDWFNIPTSPGEAWDQIKDMASDAWQNIKDCVSGIIDWEDLADWLVKAIRTPLKQVSKDIVEPGVYVPHGLDIIEDILGGGWKLLKEFVKITMPSPNDILDCFQSGTNYVPRDGAYYLHRGEAVVPAAQNTGTGGNITFINRGIITTNDIDTWFAERMDKAQSRKIGIQYQPIKTDQVGLSL